MLILDRQNKIIEYLIEKRVATVSELAEYFDVHEATIRRDLSKLEKQRKLERTHGGVVLTNEVASEPAFHQRKTEQLNEKIRIGNFTATLVKEGMNIILDSGTTTYHIANSIAGMKNIRVITNDINIASRLGSSKGIEVIVTGGRLLPESYLLNGMITEETLKNLNVNLAFIGTPAFHHQKGVTHFSQELASTKKIMIESAKKSIIVADHTKINKTSLFTFAECKDIHALVTTRKLNDFKKKQSTLR